MRLKLNLVSAVLALLGLGLTHSSETDNGQTVHQIAVIGAGAAGSSATYHLNAYAKQAGIRVNITLFEKTNRIGGRTLTISPYDDPSLRVELGASIFIEKNHILYGALQEFNLSKRIPDEDKDPVLGIWDGEKFVFTIDERGPFWWTALKVIWKYGFMAPRRTQKLMQTTINKFLRMYEEPFFPFRSLTQRAHESGLVEITAVTGQELLKANKIDDHYAHDIVQASTRVNYASNLGFIHGLDTMVSMAPEGAMSVEGGNWQIFHKMVESSGAILALNTSVVALEFAEESATSTRPQYAIRTASSTLSSGTRYPVTFDDVIIAGPYQFSNIVAAENVIPDPIDEIPYVQLHVTIFSSTHRYSPQFFGLDGSTSIPGTILTTLSEANDPAAGDPGAGKAGFFSISILRNAINPKTGRKEYIYKIFSPNKITPEFLSDLLGAKVPGTFIDNNGESGGDSPISWYYPHVFYSYPKALPRVTFQDPVVGRGIYYTSGMESFISTMETNALMGKNVARLLVDDILGSTATDNGAVFVDDLVGEGKQHILAQPAKDQAASPTPIRDL